MFIGPQLVKTYIPKNCFLIVMKGGHAYIVVL